MFKVQYSGVELEVLSQILGLLGVEKVPYLSIDLLIEAME